MPLQCKFNKPTDTINGDEYVQCIYAMRLWKLQDEMGLSFESASMCLWPLRYDVPIHIMRYRSDIDVDNREQMEKIEERLWEEEHLIEDEVYKWESKHNKRFQGILPDLETEEDHLPGEYTRPEFRYYD